MNQPKGGASMIFRGPHTDVSAPKINVVDFVLGDISAHENKTAIIQSETNRKISYRELSDSISRLAAGLQTEGFKKGDVLAVARVAGIQAAKKCSDLIPLCHPLMLSKVSVELAPNTQNNCIDIIATAKLTGKTGVEMEALTAASIAALTVYDMCKAVDRFMIIDNVQLLEKKGGKSGHWVLKNE